MVNWRPGNVSNILMDSNLGGISFYEREAFLGLPDLYSSEATPYSIIKTTVVQGVRDVLVERVEVFIRVIL